MPLALPITARGQLDKALAAATAAVEAYNRAGRRFRTAQYIVVITMAWTAAFHAVFDKKRRRPWYSDGSGRGTRYKRIDGEPKHWELEHCLKQWFAEKNPPERQNLRFLIGRPTTHAETCSWRCGNHARPLPSGSAPSVTARME